MTRRELPGGGSGRRSRRRAPGTIEWRSSTDIARSRFATYLGIVLLAPVVVLWLLPLTDPTFFGPEAEDDGYALLAVALLELFTVTPLVLLILRARRLERLRRQLDDATGAEQRADHLAGLRDVDQDLWRVARLAALVPTGSAAETAREAVDAAETASEARRDLRRRRDELASLIESTGPGATRRSLEVARDGCDEALARLHQQLDELGAALATLVDAADDDDIGTELDRVRSAADRVASLAAGLQAVDELSQLRLPAVPDQDHENL